MEGREGWHDPFGKEAKAQHGSLLGPSARKQMTYLVPFKNREQGCWFQGTSQLGEPSLLWGRLSQTLPAAPRVKWISGSVPEASTDLGLAVQFDLGLLARGLGAEPCPWRWGGVGICSLIMSGYEVGASSGFALNSKSRGTHQW